MMMVTGFAKWQTGGRSSERCFLCTASNYQRGLSASLLQRTMSKSELLTAVISMQFFNWQVLIVQFLSIIP